MEVRGEHGAGSEVEDGHCAYLSVSKVRESDVVSRQVGGEEGRHRKNVRVKPWPFAAGKVAAFMLVTPPGEKL
jgi:hypothetical protein